LELVARLRPKLPATLTRAFFSDDGSTAVEVALKMAFQAQLQRGAKGRDRFGALRGGYHGDTLGAVGVGELENFMTGLFSPLLLACDRLEVPEDPRRELHPDLTGWPERLESARRAIGDFFTRRGERLAAFIAEPLIQCAGGMRMWPPELLQELRIQCDAHGVYLILDEVATGFGRTGTFLACEQAGVAPDLLCLSKGLTGGTLPLSMTWATEAIYSHFWGEPASGRAFLHGHSYTANATACAVACASLALFDDEPVMAHAASLHLELKAAFTTLAAHPAVRQARVLGTIGACRLVDPATGVAHDPEARFGWNLHRRALDHGLLVRPIGDCLYLMPPLSTPPTRIGEAAETLLHLLSE
jgi:adenosylmethionine---8-amino-7-oxononanoate aminotransferase